MKDVASCDKPRGAANRLRSGDFRMGQPGGGHTSSSPAEFIGGWKQTRGSEPSQYPEEKKAIAIPSVAASERGTAQTERASVLSGLWGGVRRKPRELPKTSLVEGSGKGRQRG
jgi:hypothetical protein